MSKRAATTKKQHYVPQFYLRQWVDSDGGFFPVRVDSRVPPKLSVFTRKSGPSSYCFENFFYAQHTGKGDEISQTLEREFSETEGLLARALPPLEAKILNYERITFEDKYHLAELMVFIWLRGRQHRMWSQGLADQFVKMVNRDLIPSLENDAEWERDLAERGLTHAEMVDFVERGEYRAETGNMFHMRLFKEMDHFCWMLAKKFWRVYISREGDFITTDAPYLDVGSSKSFYGNHFMLREQSFPLSPRVMIVATAPRHLSDQAKTLIRKDVTGKPARVAVQNCHHLMSSLKFGFHKRRDLLTELEQLVHAVYRAQSSKPGWR